MPAWAGQEKLSYLEKILNAFSFTSGFISLQVRHSSGEASVTTDKAAALMAFASCCNGKMVWSRCLGPLQLGVMQGMYHAV